jgi:hypothetical protein
MGVVGKGGVVGESDERRKNGSGCEDLETAARVASSAPSLSQPSAVPLSPERAPAGRSIEIPKSVM